MCGHCHVDDKERVSDHESTRIARRLFWVAVLDYISISRKKGLLVGSGCETLSATGASGELAKLLQAPRSKVSEWLQRYQKYGVDGLLEGYRSGRPSELTEEQQQALGDVLDSGPVAYGLDSGIWTSPTIAWVIEEELGVQYHPGHVRKLLHECGFSVQRPRCVLARADAAAQDRWHRCIYPALKKALSCQWALSSPTTPASGKTRRSMPPGAA